MQQAPSQHHLPSSASRAVDLILDPGISIPASETSPTRYYELSRCNDPVETEPEPFPVWISASLLVAYCAIFWVGAITIGSWGWHAITTALLP